MKENEFHLIESNSNLTLSKYLSKKKNLCPVEYIKNCSDNLSPITKFKKTYPFENKLPTKISKRKYDNISLKSVVVGVSIVKLNYLQISWILFLSLSNLFVKISLSMQCLEGLLTEIRGMHNTLTFFCGIYLMTLSALLIKIDKIDLSTTKNFNKSEIDHLFIRSILGFLSIHLLVCTLENMRLVSALTLLYLSPIFSTFIMMKKNMEKIKNYDKLCLLIAIFIIFLFLFQNTGNLSEYESNLYIKDSISGVLYSLIASVINSINNIFDQKVSNEFHCYPILFTTGLISIILSPMFMAVQIDKFSMDLNYFLIYFLFGTSYFFALYFNYKYINAIHSHIYSSFHIISIFLGYLYTFFIFNELFTWVDVFGSILMIIINFYMKLRGEECEENETL